MVAFSTMEQVMMSPVKWDYNTLMYGQLSLF